ncbi:hypothetical protein [Cellvibrio polysaccharolyticus]|uniref:Uncharacterized protein n=1 Tax=Cellvibrio polysaccharolyticus TaxID=2082724 RepID=A0A928V3W3_9GAMM|nr:hypothetical protein [Cellvibrio polysaccharolyticus]MBE8717802.1 hypothetical protein [Cellvibrio polysaccharolyticus]
MTPKKKRRNENDKVADRDTGQQRMDIQKAGAREKYACTKKASSADSWTGKLRVAARPTHKPASLQTAAGTLREL